MSDKAWPNSPRSLLEARYNAMVAGKIDFLLETHHPDNRSQVDRLSLEKWSKESKWEGIKIEKEWADGERAFVAFTARYGRDFEIINHRENAEFRQADGKWFYFDSDFPKPESIKREGDKVGRNDPCACGSGKKAKKCCGAK